MLPIAQTPHPPIAARPSLRDGALWFIVGAVALISLLHYLTDIRLLPYHSVYRSLYYLPIAVAAVRYGRWGGTLTALIIGVLYLPHVVRGWDVMPHEGFSNLLEQAVFLFVGALTGSLADAERIQRQHTQLAIAQVQRGERLAALGRLASGLAHEIRNPLGIMRAAAQMLHRDLAHDARRAEYTAVIQAEVDRVDHLIEQLLAFARPRATQRTAVDVAALLERTLVLTHAYAEQHGVALYGDSAPDLPPVVADGELLLQALVNLVLNGVQATDAGGTVTISGGAERSSVCIAVRDTGRGIAPADLPHIFDPFFTTRAGGTGLGLSIVQQIATEHGGTVDVQNAPGAGALVMLRFPRGDIAILPESSNSFTSD